MSHVDDGTLHAYLDGELSPAEAQGIDAHLAQCPGCRERLEEERALITRAGELLARAAPPDRELPPFRAGDVKPPTRLWWQVRLPLAWAATVALALGIGTYLGRGVEPVPHAQTVADTQPAEYHAQQVPLSSDLARPEPRVKVRGAARAPAAAQPAAPTSAAAPNEADVARQRDERVAVRSETSASAALAREKAPSAAKPAVVSSVGIVSLEDGSSVPKERSPISADSARRLLGTDPLIVPGLPIRAIYRGRDLGYSGLVLVEQALDSSTVIEVVNGRRAPLMLDQVVVTGAGAEGGAVAARPDSVSAAERALVGRARVADSLAARPRYAGPQRVSEKAADRPGSDLFSDVRGPLSADSLAALRRLLQPLRP